MSHNPQSKTEDPKLAGTGRLLWSIVGPHRKMALFLLSVLILSAAAESMSLVMIYPLLESLLPDDGEGGGIPVLRTVLNWFPEQYELLVVCALAFGVIVFKNLLILYRAYLSKSFLGRLRLYWSGSILENCLHSRFIWHLRQKQGVILENVLHEPNYASKCLRDLIDLVSKSFLVACLTLSLFAFNWRVTLATIAVGAVICMVQWGYTRRHSHGIGKKKILLHQELSGIVAESLAGVRQIKIFSMESGAAKMFDAKMSRLMRLLVRLGVIQELPNVIGEVFVVGLILGTLFYFVYGAGMEFAEILPLIGVFVFCAQRISQNLGMLLSQRVSVISYVPSLRLVDSLMRSADIREETGGSESFERLGDRIALDNVHFSYDGKHEVFKGLSLDMPKGQITAITGPSGSGKSTVCDLVTGLLQPADGRVLVDGRDLRGYNLRSWREKIGYVSQESFFFNATILENILSGRPGGAEEKAAEAARLAGAHEFIERFPEGYNTRIGESGVRMSVGQRQRLAIARALMREPEILILDEVTSALDTKNEMDIIGLIRDLRRRGFTIVMVTHRIASLRAADAIHVLDRGELAESGTYGDLLRNQSLFARLDELSRAPLPAG